MVFGRKKSTSPPPGPPGEPSPPGLIVRLSPGRIEAIPQANAPMKGPAAALANRRAAQAAELDIKGDTLLDLVKQMGPDDWHELADKWDWDDHTPIMQWVVSQPECDRATAVIIMCLGNVQDVARWMTSYPAREGEQWNLVWDIARRLGEGFYRKAELQCGINLTGKASLIEAARSTGRNPWQFPPGILTDGHRKPQPRYTFDGRNIHFHPEEWIARTSG